MPQAASDAKTGAEPHRLCRLCRSALRSWLRRLLDALMGAASALWRGGKSLAALADEDEAEMLARVDRYLQAYSEAAAARIATRGEITAADYYDLDPLLSAARRATTWLKTYNRREDGLHRAARRQIARAKSYQGSANLAADKALSRLDHCRAGAQPVLLVLGEPGQARLDQIKLM